MIGQTTTIIIVIKVDWFVRICDHIVVYHTQTQLIRFIFGEKKLGKDKQLLKGFGDLSGCCSLNGAEQIAWRKLLTRKIIIKRRWFLSMESVKPRITAIELFSFFDWVDWR